MRSSYVRLTLLSLTILVAPPLARAQATVELRVPSSVYVNEAFQAEIVVSQYQQRCDTPRFPNIAGCKVQSHGSGRNSSIQRDPSGTVVQRVERVFKYSVTPTEIGQLLIPAIALRVDGQPLSTKPTRINVVRPGTLPTDELAWVEVLCPRKQVYVGQRVPLTMFIWLRAAEVYGRALSANEMYSVAFDWNRTRLDPFPKPERFRERRFELDDGTIVTCYAFETACDYMPPRPGPLTFDELAVALNYPTHFRRGMFFDQLSVAASRDIVARFQPVDVEVLALPDEGRPPGFTGAVGTFDIAVTAAPTEVRVGDPIELAITIRGDGPIDALQPPRLSTNKTLTDGFRLSADAPGGSVDGSRKSFSAVIRAESPDVIEIPPIEYPYFDPDRGEYVVARSVAVPITVRAAQQLAPSALEGLDAPTADDRPASRPLNGLLEIETAEAELLASGGAVRPLAVNLVLGMPPLVFLLAWGYATFVHPRAADTTRRRRNNAGRVAARRLARARKLDPRPQAAEIAATLAGYIADRLDEPPGRVAGRAAVDTLQRRGVFQETCQRFATLLEHCERVSFSGADDAPDTLTREAQTCLAELERQRL